MQDGNTALRKRTQIANANRTMFVWVAGASVIVGFAAVIFVFLFQKMIFNHKIIDEKQKTVSALEHNIETIDQLEDEVRVLETNQNLMKVKANSDDRTIQVILDALPAEANSLALGASLQNKLLAGIDNLAIESLQVDPVLGVEQLTDDAVEDASDENGGIQSSITLRFTVVGPERALQELLKRIERSIRVIDISALSVESRGNVRAMTIQARAYYEPAKQLQLQDKVVRP